MARSIIRSREEQWELVLRIVFPLCAAATILFIFANSSDSETVSGSKSILATTLLNDLAAKLGIGWRPDEPLIRKLAHFAEYALLGFFLLLTLSAYTRRIGVFLAWPLLGGLLTAVCDECYQLHVPGRSGQVSDVAIDFGGVVTGALVGILVFYLVRRLYRRPRKKAMRIGRRRYGGDTA